MATITRGELQDIHYSFYEKKEDIQEQAIVAYLRAVKLVGMDETIMVTPQRQYEGLTVDTFNRLIQKRIINMSSNVFLQYGEKRYYVGDKIIQRENDYRGKGVVNGEMGYIKDILADRFIVSFIDKDVEYVKDELKQIDLAYCISGHKYQGSQAKIVIVVFDISSYKMLSKQWLYTGITRAIDIGYVISSHKAFAIAVSTDHTKRRTFLQHIIKEERDGH